MARFGAQWGYSKMQGTDGLRPGEAAPDFRERKKGGELFLWMTPLLETCQLHLRTLGRDTVPLSVPTWTGSDALGPTVQKPAGGGRGHPQRKTSILWPGVPPQPSLSPSPPILVQGIRIHIENESTTAVPS